MSNFQKPVQTQYKPLERGYRPVGKLNTQHPPQGGSAVPSKPVNPPQQTADKRHS